jgi:hypothetical protein
VVMCMEFLTSKWLCLVCYVLMCMELLAFGILVLSLFDFAACTKGL